jgi:hypothetical protein
MDWLLFALLALGLIGFYWMISSKSSPTGQVGGIAYDEGAACYRLDSGLPAVVTYERIVLCPNFTHSVSYFVIQVDQTIIDCQGSLVKGKGGALLLPENVNNPRVTLKDCVLEGYEGLYSSQNPADVYVLG